MKPTSFLALAGATGVAVVLAAASATLSDVGDAIADRDRPLVEGLTTKAADVAEIIADSESGRMTITRRDGKLVGASGYPVKTDVIRELVNGLAMMTIEERKTADPARYAELGLADRKPEPGEQKGAGSRLVLKTASGGVIADVVLGARDYTVGGTRGGMFVRRSSDPQTFLVRGAIAVPSTRDGWFDDRLVDLPEDAVTKITASDAGTTRFEIARNGKALALVSVPEGRSADESKVGRVNRFFAPLTFNDVRKAGSAEPKGPVLELRTKDGVAVTVTALAPRPRRPDGAAADWKPSAADLDTAAWVQVSARAESDEGRKAAEAITAKVAGFEFRLPDGDMEAMWSTPEELTTAPKS